MKPILFNTDMVRGILNGTKTVTRRVVKPHYRAGEAGFRVVTNKHTGEYVRIEIFDEWEDETRWLNEPYHPGDILYVREAYRLVDFDFIDGDWNASVQYKADEGIGPRLHYLPNGVNERCGWRPSIHMPREAARIFLRVMDVRVERLQDIDNAGALAEGCDGRCEAPQDGALSDCQKAYDFSVERFSTVWDSTIKPADRDLYGWAANPWVWVISFERISRDEVEV